MNSTSENEMAGGTRAQHLALPIELSAEKIQDFQASFAIMDRQSKGFVCADDILQVANAAGMNQSSVWQFLLPTTTFCFLEDMKFSMREAHLLLGSADEDHSGGIDMREFLSIMTTPIHPQDLEEELRGTFSVFDKDNNGTINVDELKRFVRVSELQREVRRIHVQLSAVGLWSNGRWSWRYDQSSRSKPNRKHQLRCVHRVSLAHVKHSSLMHRNS